MKADNIIRWLVAGCGLILPAVELPYYISAMIHSPLDRWSWIFVVAALLMLAAMSVRLPENNCRFTLAALLPMAIFGAAFIFAETRHIHALAMIAGCGFSWSASYLAFGWASAYMLVPSYGMLALGATSLRYRLEETTGVDGLLLQALIAAGLAAWQMTLLKSRRRPKVSDFIFAILAIMITLGAFMSGRLRMQQAFVPNFSKCVFGRYRGISIPLDESDRRFFGNSKVERYRFPEDHMMPDGRVLAIEVLKVSNFENVHKIHPPGHCLTVTGNTILSEEICTEIICGVKIDINEIVASDPAGMRFLVWAWYSTPVVSSGNFDALRYNYDSNANWHEYLLRVPLTGTGDDQNRGRALLRDFLSTVTTDPRQEVDLL